MTLLGIQVKCYIFIYEEVFYSQDSTKFFTVEEPGALSTMAAKVSPSFFESD